MMEKPQEIGKFIEKMIEEKNFENIDSEIKAQIKRDLLERVEDRINATILENMPSEKMEEFSKLVDSANSEEIQNFCHINITNLDKIIAQALIDFRETYLNA